MNRSKFKKKNIIANKVLIYYLRYKNGSAIFHMRKKRYKGVKILSWIFLSKTWWNYTNFNINYFKLKSLSLQQNISIHLTKVCGSLSSVLFSSVARCVRLFTTPWTAACQASLSISNSRNLPKPMSIELVMPSNHLILCHPLLLLPSIFPSIRVFSNESALAFCIRWPKYWSFSFNVSPSNEHPGLISFRIH